MRSGLRRTVLIVGLALTATAAEALELEGFVVDGHDELLAGVTVSIEGTPFVTQTDSLGAFRFTDVPRGRYTISARRACVVSGYVADVTLPRPLRVPLPVVAYDTNDPDAATVPESEAAAALGPALRAAIREASWDFATALLADGSVCLVAPDLDSTFTLEPNRTAPVAAHPVAGSPALVARFRPGGAKEVLVSLSLVPLDVPEEFRFLHGDRAVLTLERGTDGAWRVVHQIYCLTERPTDPPVDAAPGIKS